MEVGWDEGTPKLPRTKMTANFSRLSNQFNPKDANIEHVGYCLLILLLIGLKLKYYAKYY